ncbi:GNAT family N-acetyltransferase [Streptomyces lavendofoliae]|uniref:Acetyltransferase n=1 Tax=Streptomyces lavendofoliae TaxID=67314 RepID=A0A918I3M4_9ACTN|nr:GNAT family N-acetyltransferase [Streptomyces lavendofoliae]GGU64514.1 acetyltransferase [Streptomyces lavendofoliae]
MEPVTLTTERLRLTPFTPADTDEVLAACQDPAIQRWIPVPTPYQRQHAEDFVGRQVPGGWRDDTEYAFSVRPREGGPLLASIGIHHPRSGCWEVGYYTVADHRGHGYAAEAVVALARWAFTDLGCARLEWRAQVGNPASRAVAEKAGFTVEGVLRAGMEHRGTVRDCWVGSLLPSDLGLASRLPYLPARPDPA